MRFVFIAQDELAILSLRRSMGQRLSEQLSLKMLR